MDICRTMMLILEGAALFRLTNYHERACLQSAWPPSHEPHTSFSRSYPSKACPLLTLQPIMHIPTSPIPVPLYSPHHQVRDCVFQSYIQGSPNAIPDHGRGIRPRNWDTSKREICHGGILWKGTEYEVSPLNCFRVLFIYFSERVCVSDWSTPFIFQMMKRYQLRLTPWMMMTVGRYSIVLSYLLYWSGDWLYRLNLFFFSFWRFFLDAPRNPLICDLISLAIELDAINFARNRKKWGGGINNVFLTEICSHIREIAFDYPEEWPKSFTSAVNALYFQSEMPSFIGRGRGRA